MKIYLCWLSAAQLLFAEPGLAKIADPQASEIIRLSDEVRSPNKPFRYTVTILEYRAGSKEPAAKQVLDISMRFMKPDGET